MQVLMGTLKSGECAGVQGEPSGQGSVKVQVIDGEGFCADKV